MSRRIVNDHRFTDDEVRYLQDRGRFTEVAANRQLFPEQPAPQPPPTETRVQRAPGPGVPVEERHTIKKRKPS